MSRKITLTGDGSGKLPREVQVQTMNWIESVWGNGKHLAISLQTGAGKSYLARSIQLATNAAIVTPNNALVRQYVSTYPDLPFNIGKANYKCGDRKINCSSIYENGVTCGDCCYRAAKEAAETGAPCVYNPISLFFARKSEMFRDHSVIVVDEAHSVLNLLYTLNSEKIAYTDTEIYEDFGIQDPHDLLNEYVLLQFLQKKLDLAKKAYDEYSHIWSIRKREQRNKKIITLDNIIVGITDSPQLYAASLEKHSVVIRCVKLPKAIIKRVFGNSRLVLLSATLFAPDLAELLQEEEYDYLDLPSPIPAANRPIYFAPTDFKINYMTPPEQIAREIENIIFQHPGVNTLVHLPYSLANRVAKEMRVSVMTHTKDNKETQLNKWLARGGIFIGSGVYEGLDLKDDLCRLNIIVKIPYPNLGDALVQKRKALKDGNLWYAAESLKAVVQSAGRSTRTETDYSFTYVLDPSFAGLVSRNHTWLPQSFLECIIWSRQHARTISKVS